MAAAATSGALVAGRVDTRIGPFDAHVALRPAWHGDTTVRIGPLGSLVLDTHDGPFGLVIDAREIDPDAARALVERPGSLANVDDRAAKDAQAAIKAVLLRAFFGALAAVLLTAILRGATKRRLAGSLGVAVAVVVAAALTARVTWDPQSISEPRYSGLLTVAPRAIGSLADVQARFDAYQEQVSSLVANLSTIYNAASTLPVLDEDTDMVRLLHVSDLHLHPGAFDLIGKLVEQFDVDAVVDTGDINDWGTTVEARYAEQIAALGVPYVYVRGNHDSSATARAVGAQPNAIVLDDDVAEVKGVRIWGIGDPRFTPDKSDAVSIEEERAQATSFAPEVARRVDRSSPVDVVMLHDPRAAERLAGRIVPLVLAGHLHKPSRRDLDGTLVLVEGSTGGAGLRGLQGDAPVPLTATVLHFGRDDSRLRAIDRISVAGLGGTGAQIERHLVDVPDDAAAGPST